MHKLTLPFVSIVIPCRNERDHIAACVRSLVEGGYSAESMEIIIADGMSDDGTRDILSSLERTFHNVRVIDNRRRVTPVGINTAIAESSGSFILLAGAHNVYDPGYVAGLVQWAMRTGADVVGGVLNTVPKRNAPLARAIAIGMSHPFGVGNAYFRIGSAEPKYVDTVAMGCYRREVFDRIGLFDEDLVRNQDDEFNLRLGRAGGRLLLVPDVRSSYVARGSLGQLWRMFYQYGRFKPLVVRKTGGSFTVRQIVPAIFVLSLLLPTLISAFVPAAAFVALASLATYLVAALLAAVVGASGELRLIPALAVVFPTMHMAYGAGYVIGAIRLALGRKRALAGDPIALTR